MNTEQQKIEYKSLQKIRTGEKGFKELSTTCVAFSQCARRTDYDWRGGQDKEACSQSGYTTRRGK